VEARTRNAIDIMKIQLKKGRDGPSTLVCIRADGSRTWSKVHPFFPVHDLTHFSVESVLGFTEGFFGLVASGWDIDTFSQPGATKRMGAEAVLAEAIVGVFDLERAGRGVFDEAEFNAALAESLSALGLPPFRFITGNDLWRIRTLRGDLVSRWWSVPEGKSIEVEFPATAGV
jgi:hypothetical protein